MSRAIRWTLEALAALTRAARGTRTSRAVAAALLVVLAVAAEPAAAHVGTNDATFDGRAGPYAVRVFVRMPGVIPGQAEITVRTLDGSPAVRRVLVQVAQWDVGRRGAPAPDAAAPYRAPPTNGAPRYR